MSAKNSTAFILIFLAILLAFEIGLRLYVGIFRPHFKVITGAKVKDDYIGWRWKPNYNQGGFITNSLGFIGEEIDPEKPKDVFRISILGDSVVAGVPPHPDGHFPGQLQIILNERKEDKCPYRFEVVNAGVNGYGTSHVYKTLERRVIPIEPDLVIIYAGWNDLLFFDVRNPALLSTKFAKIGYILLENIYILKALVKIYLKIRPVDEATPEKISYYSKFDPVEFRMNYYKIIDLAKQNGINISICTLASLLGAENLEKYEHKLFFPTFTKNTVLLKTLWRRYNQVIYEIASEKNVMVLDMARRIEDLQDEGQHFTDTHHMGLVGYKIFAEKLYLELKEKKLIPCH